MSSFRFFPDEGRLVEIYWENYSCISIVDNLNMAYLMQKNTHFKNVSHEFTYREIDLCTTSHML